jgi:hypothetical protein
MSEDVEVPAVMLFALVFLELVFHTAFFVLLNFLFTKLVICAQQNPCSVQL